MIPLKTLLRSLVVGEIVFAWYGPVLDSQFPELLPKPLQDYMTNITSQSGKSMGLACFYSVLSLTLYLSSAINLWKLKRFGRLLYTIISVISLLLNPLIGETLVYSSIADTFHQLSSACGGGVLVLIWFSPIKDDLTEWVVLRSYADVPWYRKRWFAIISLPLVHPIYLILALTGEIYYEKKGQIVMFSHNMKAFLFVLGIIFMALGAFLNMRYG